MKLKLLKKLKLLTVIIVFSSCGNTATKPSIESKLIVIDENIIFIVNNQTGEEREIPLTFLDGSRRVLNESLDKNTCHSNDDWGKILTYIRLLEPYVPSRIRKELKKINNINELKMVRE